MLTAGSSALGGQTALDSSIRALLQQHHPSDTGETWRALGSDAPAEIMRLYSASGADTFAKIRLLQGLAWFDDPKAGAFVEHEVDSTDTSVLRNAAIRSLAGERGVSELDFVAKFLKHPDPHTRVAAALGLRLIDDPRARALYEQYLLDEKIAWALAQARGPVPGAAAPSGGGQSRRRLADFAGAWRGFWVAPAGALAVGTGTPLPGALPSPGPSPGPSAELLSRPAWLTLGPSGGELVVEAGKAKVELSGLLLRGGKLTGILKSGAGSSVPFDAELVPTQGISPSDDLFLLRAFGIGAIFSARKAH